MTAETIEHVAQLFERARLYCLGGNVMRGLHEGFAPGSPNGEFKKETDIMDEAAHEKRARLAVP